MALPTRVALRMAAWVGSLGQSVTLVQQQYLRKLFTFDFSIEYKMGLSNKAVDVLSRMYEDDEVVKSAFLALSKLIPTLLEDMKLKCKTQSELQNLLQRIQARTEVTNYYVRDDTILYKNIYCIA